MHESAPDHVILAANARMPSERAQSIQVAHAARGFGRAGARATLLYAKRRGTPVGAAREVFAQIGPRESAGEDAGAPLPELVAVPCFDAIDLVPPKLQFPPARLQEWTFGRNAARMIDERWPAALVVARDIEVAARLRHRAGLAWEAHRVPGGRLRRSLMQKLLAAGTRVVAISEGVREDLEAAGFDPARILVEHDAHDPALVAALPSREDARRALGLDPARPTVVYCGSLLAWKGVDVLVEAARRLEGVQVVIAGGMARDVDELRGRAAGAANVRIDGFQPSARVATYLAAADVSVVPNRRTPRISSHYTSPLKVFEALGAGVPLVASDLPSLRGAIGPDAAVFVEPEDAGALAAGIRRVLDEPDLGERLRAAGRARAAGATWDARAARILDWLRAARGGDHAR